MSKIRIVNWLLTRKCNLKCDYCAIVKNYNNKPNTYPDMSHYHKNEMTTQQVIETLRKLKIHNPYHFNIFYGGEPLLRDDLPEIINYCNENDIFYTIISNNTPEIQDRINNLLNKTEYIQGFTSSVDPVFNELGADEDRVEKSVQGLIRLKDMQKSGKIKDVVAEITVMKHNQHLLYRLVKDLSEHEIYSDITFVDTAKSNYYDFSNVTDSNLLVQPTFELASMLRDMKEDESLLIHMKNILLPWMFDTLPSNFDCGIEKGLHNITIDADGSIRLCLRIRGRVVPHMYNINNLFLEDPQYINDHIMNSIKIDKSWLCESCNHSCLMMSKIIDNSTEGVDDLVHMDKRGD